MISMIIGTIGVLILLIAFGLNITHRITENSNIYLIMNIIGSLMAAWYAYAGNVYPFVVLEIVWAITALVRLILNKSVEV